MYTLYRHTNSTNPLIYTCPFASATVSVSDTFQTNVHKYIQRAMYECRMFKAMYMRQAAKCQLEAQQKTLCLLATWVYVTPPA